MNSLDSRLIEKKNSYNHLQSTRSILYALEPVGIGTPYVESLTSYICRLSINHNVVLGTLLKEVIGPFIDNPYLTDYLTKGRDISKSYLINGLGKTSASFINVIEKLTERNDIQYLTMNNWIGVFSNNITVSHRRWCPFCLNQFKLDSIEIHEPLIWSISDIQKCDIHEAVLREKCPECGKKQRFIQSKLILGHCSYCYTWLGEAVDRRYCQELSEYETFIINNFKQLIEKAPDLTSFPTRNKISSILSVIKEKLRISSNAKLSNFLGVNNPTLCTWINNQALPTPENLLQITKKIGSTIYELIYKDEINIKIGIPNEKNLKTKKKVSKKEMEEHLTEATHSKEPKSLNQVSREGGFSHEAAENNFPLLSKIIKKNYASYQKDNRIKKQLKLEKTLTDCLDLEIPISLQECLHVCGVPPTTAKRYVPDLCKKVTVRHREYLANQSKAREEKISGELKNVILDLHNKGIYPSINAVTNFSTIPGILIERKYYELRIKILISLGYKI